MDMMRTIGSVLTAVSMLYGTAAWSADTNSDTDLFWRDDHLGYKGSLTKDARTGSLSLRIIVVDLAQKVALGDIVIQNLDVRPGPKTGVMMALGVSVKADSTDGKPHDHQFSLHFEPAVTTFRLTRSCGPKDCYDAQGVVTTDAAFGILEAYSAYMQTAQQLAQRQIQFQSQMQNQLNSALQSMQKDRLESSQRILETLSPNPCTEDRRRRRECY